MKQICFTPKIHILRLSDCHCFIQASVVVVIFIVAVVLVVVGVVIFVVVIVAIDVVVAVVVVAIDVAVAVVVVAVAIIVAGHNNFLDFLFEFDCLSTKKLEFEAPLTFFNILVTKNFFGCIS